METDPAFPVWPAEQRSGDPDVDRVLDALMTYDAATLATTVQYFSRPCLAPVPVIGKPPFCVPDEAVGTIVLWWFATGTEGSWYRQGEEISLSHFAAVVSARPRVVAVYEQATELPKGRIVILLALTLQYEGSGQYAGPDESHCCPAALRLIVDYGGLTGILGSGPRNTLLPPDANYLVPVHSSP